MTVARIAALAALGLVFASAPAAAQPLGTFRWQLQPFCNIITVNVTQQGGIYSLDGTDDRCGGGNQPGSVVGIAYMTPLGLVGFGLTTVLPNGTPVHTEATISIASLNGTWRDSAGNNGNYIFTPGAGIGGAPRPIPSGGVAPASITNIQIANNAVNGTNVIDGSLSIADLADPPRSNFNGGNQSVTLTAVDAIIRSVGINAPAGGRVIVIASGYFAFPSAATSDGARCSIEHAPSATVDINQLIIGSEFAADSVDFLPFAGTRAFTVAAGANTFRLVCEVSAGAADVRDTAMSAIFIPGP